MEDERQLSKAEAVLGLSIITCLLLGLLGAYIYRDVYPLVTYHNKVGRSATFVDDVDRQRQVVDAAEGWIIWAKIWALLVAEIVIPLFIPRQYVPVDPKVRLSSRRGHSS